MCETSSWMCISKLSTSTTGKPRMKVYFQIHNLFIACKSNHHIWINQSLWLFFHFQYTKSSVLLIFCCQHVSLQEQAIIGCMEQRNRNANAWGKTSFHTCLKSIISSACSKNRWETTIESQYTLFFYSSPSNYRFDISRYS